MISIGFSIGHDRGAVLIRDGKVVVGISKERLSRIKSDEQFQNDTIPVECIDYCLNEVGLTYDDVDLYCYNCTMFDDVEEQFVEKLGQPVEKLYFIPHHLAHGYSTYYSSPFSDSVVVVADAMGSLIEKGNRSWQWFTENGYVLEDTSELEYDWAEGITIYQVRDNKFEEVYKKWIKFEFPWEVEGEQTSVGGYYGTGTYQLVYNPINNTWQAGKLMGLASYAESEYVDSVPRQTYRDGMDVFIPTMKHRPDVDYRDDFQLKANVAGVYQREQEEISMELARIGKDLTDEKNICVAGGSFLNCNTNEKIIKSELFEGTYFVPPADDSGIPLGCAWAGYIKLDPDFKKPNELQSPYLGREYSRQEIADAIALNDTIHHIYYPNFDELTDRVAELLDEGKVIGWMQGGSEIGPRALGNRSILANPTKGWMTNYVNELKGREWYRPFAPSVLYDKQSEIFDLDTFSPYMLVTANVKDEWKSKIPAVTHIDGTSRYQSVVPYMNERYYKLIESFYSRTGIPLVLNTSFNGPGEPIVETPENAINTFINRGLHYLVIGNYLIFKINK